eukprot:Nk52_evm70s554 gene=Nk52_evmTU70s554
MRYSKVKLHYQLQPSEDHSSRFCLIQSCVRLGNDKLVENVKTTVDVPVVHDDSSSSTLTEFLVLDVKSYKCTLGRDLMSDSIIPGEEEQTVESIKGASGDAVEQKIDENERAKLMAGIAKELERNLSIEKGNFCNVPESVIKLVLKDEDNIICHKTRIPNQKYVHVRDVTIGKWKDNGRIVEMESPWKHGFVCVSKIKKGEEGTDDPHQPVRVTSDMRDLKKLLFFNQYPIQRISHIIHKAAKAKYISIIDLEGGYHQFRVHEDSMKYLSFEWNNKSYCYKGAPEGLPQLTGVFQKVMNIIMKGQDAVKVYVDDLTIMTDTLDEHIEAVNGVEEVN